MIFQRFANAVPRILGRRGAVFSFQPSVVLRRLRTATKQYSSLLATGTGTAMAISFFAAKADEQLGALPPDVRNYDKVIAEADALYDSYLIENAYSILRKYASSNNCELLWRLGRVVCEKAKLSKDPKAKKELMFEAFALVEKALQHEPERGSFGVHKWYAILLDYIGELEGNRSRIEKSYKVREHLEKALSIDPYDATTWYILGVWHYSFADMPGYTRLIAKTIFGTPPSSTYQEALRNFEKAELIQPNFYSKNTFALGEVNEKLGNKQEAIMYYKRAFKMPVVSADDQEVHAKAHQKLKKAGVKDSELV